MDREDLKYSPVEARIDLGRIRSNLRAMQSLAGGGHVMAVVKANAYGHGSVDVARALRGYGVGFFAVAQLPEALELRRAGITERIVVFGIPRERELPIFSEYGLDLVAGSDRIVRWIASGVGLTNLHVHLKVDTGMHRLGVSPGDAGEAVRVLQSNPGVHLAGLWTHLANSDEPSDPFTIEQARQFEPVVHEYGDAFDHVHVAASSGLWNFRELAALAPRMLVRLGISLYGYLEDGATSRHAGLSPAMQFVSRVVQMRRVRAGEGVSYNRTWTAREDSLVATVAAGYADGFPRLLSNRARVGIGGREYPVVGTVCMDMLTVLLGTAGFPCAVSEDDEVILFGEGGPSAFEVARWAETIVYEVCTNIPARVRRTYSGGGTGIP